MATLVEYSDKLQRAVDLVITPLGVHEIQQNAKSGRSTFKDRHGGGGSGGSTQPYIYNWQVVCSNVQLLGTGNRADIAIHAEADMIVRMVEALWQKVIEYSYNPIMPEEYRDQEYLHLMLTGRIFTQPARDNVASLAGVEIPCYVTLEYVSGMAGGNSYEPESRNFSFKLGTLSTARKRVDFGERDLSHYSGEAYTKDCVILAAVDVNGNVHQIECGVPQFYALGRKPSDFEDIEDANGLYPTLPTQRS